MEKLRKRMQSMGIDVLWVGLAVVVLVVVGVFTLVTRDPDSSNQSAIDPDTTEQLDEANDSVDVSPALSASGLRVDFSKSSIPLDEVLSGGPGKDGIPAITDPQFVRLQDSDVLDSVQVMYVQHGAEERLYPYNVLVWHEIVNDTIDGKPLAITFCPLCGSAIVFEREIDGEIVDFGVSGFLYQSNLLMYSREEPESLWSQSRGEAVVGTRSGTSLVHYPTQVMTFGEAKELFPDALVMSTNTGFDRNYNNTPYSGYDETEDTIFPVSVEDKRFFAKEIFYIVPLEGMSIAVRQDKEDGTYDVPDTDITVTFDRGQVTAKWGEAILPGYFEMWFSWATHNQDTGIVL